MRTHVRLSRAHKAAWTAPQFRRPVALTRNIIRAERSVPPPNIAAPTPPSSPWAGFQSDPYVDYGRWLTPEGGILIAYKDLDLRLRHILWRIFAWTAATGGEGWYLFHPPVHSFWLNLVGLLVLGILNWLIVANPVELYRRVEIRPDCMVIEGSDVFWLSSMECGWPAFRPDKDGNQVLCGVYGTRFVEYLTVRRFNDEYDRTPDVIAAHLQDAMRQLWETTLATGTA